MIIIKEAPQTDLVYYSRLSNEIQNKVSQLRQKINDFVDYLNENSIVLVTLNDDTLYNVNSTYKEDNYIYIDEFDSYLDSNDLKKKFVGRSADYFIRDNTDDFINDFLYELEDTEINFNTVCVAIETSYLTYDEYYNDMLDNNLEETAIDEMMKDNIMSGLTERETIADISTAIQDLYKDIVICIKNIKTNMKPLLDAYNEFDNLAEEVSSAEKVEVSDEEIEF